MIKSVLVFHLCISVHKDNPPPIKGNDKKCSCISFVYFCS